MKMKLFPITFRDRVKDLFLKLGKEFNTWTEMEEEFLRKYYSVEKLPSLLRLFAGLSKARVKLFIKLGRDLETSIGSV